MNRITVWLVFGLVLAVLIGLCGAALALSRNARPGPDATQGNAIIDWVDFVRWNGQSYDRLHNAALTSPDRAGKPLGTVRFRLEGHVGNPYYAAKDGDAAFLDEGTRSRRCFMSTNRGNPRLRSTASNFRCRDRAGWQAARRS